MVDLDKYKGNRKELIEWNSKMEKKSKRNKFNCANRCDDANSCYKGDCSHCQSYEPIKKIIYNKWGGKVVDR